MNPYSLTRKFLGIAFFLVLCISASIAQSGNRSILRLNGNRVIVKFNANTSYSYINAMRTRYNATVVDSLTTPGMNTYLWQIAFPIVDNLGRVIADVITATETGKSQTQVDMAPDQIFESSDTEGSPMDSLYDLLPNCQDAHLAYGTCNIPAGNRNVTVAVIDAGLDGHLVNGDFAPNHAIFQNRLWQNAAGHIGYDFVDNDPFPIDNNGHGTHVAGIIARQMQRFNANSVKLMILRVMDSTGRGTVWNLCKALDFAIANNANIVNMSLNYNGHETSFLGKDAIEQIIKQAGFRTGNKMLFVSTAGNDGVNIERINRRARILPANFDMDNLIVATTQACEGNGLADFANFGKNNVDVAAPGVDVFSTSLNGKWNFRSGTSMSAAFVTAAAALNATRRISNNFNYSNISSILADNTTTSPRIGKINWKGRLATCPSEDENLMVNPNVTAAANTTAETLRAYPNPFEQTMTIEFNATTATEAQLSITNAVGQVVKTNTMQCYQGANVVAWEDTNALQSGVYIISIRTQEGDSFIKKVLKR